MAVTADLRNVQTEKSGLGSINQTMAYYLREKPLSLNQAEEDSLNDEPLLQLAMEFCTVPAA